MKLHNPNYNILRSENLPILKKVEEEACARARNRWQNNLFLINVFIWFLSNPEYFICFTNIKFILEHLFINLSVLEIYYFCPILKKSK